MSEHTDTGIVRAGRQVVDLAETDSGARLDAAAHLDAADLRHVSRLTGEMAVNAERRRLVNTGVPAVSSFAQD